MVEVKSFINYDAGDIGLWLRSMAFKSCKTWMELKTFLRNVYGSVQQTDLVLELRQILKLGDREHRSLIENNARIEDHLTEFITKLNGSNWTEGNKITTRNLKTLLKLAIRTLSLTDALVENFDEDLKPTSIEVDVMQMVHKQKSKVQNLDVTIFTGKTPSTGHVDN